MDFSEEMKLAADWLNKAQDVGSDNGYSSHYDLNLGWATSYPEVSGYIIPTMLDYAKIVNDVKIDNNIIKCSDWLISIQLPSGAFQGRLIGDLPVTPVIFNTGMILFGLKEAFLKTKDLKYRDSATKAADWLVDVQSSDGLWRKHLTLNGTGESHDYHTRVSWGILEINKIHKKDEYLSSATKNIEWVINNHQNKNGWFTHTDLLEEKNNEPLIHFLVYTIRGILECGRILDNNKWIDSAILAARGLLNSQIENGRIFARYDSNWNPTVNWVCLTGVAQISIVYTLIYKLTNDSIWIESADENIKYLLKNVGSKVPEINGSLSGSMPVNESYMTNCYISWATKFLLELLILRRTVS